MEVYTGDGDLGLVLSGKRKSSGSTGAQPIGVATEQEGLNKLIEFSNNSTAEATEHGRQLAIRSH